MLMQITSNKVVTLRYKMSNGRGEVIENILGGPAISYIQGSGKILSALEGELDGMTHGEEKMIYLKKEDHETLDDDFRIEIVVDEVRSATNEELERGLVEQTVEEDVCGDDCIC